MKGYKIESETQERKRMTPAAFARHEKAEPKKVERAERKIEGRAGKGSRAAKRSGY